MIIVMKGNVCLLCLKSFDGGAKEAVEKCELLPNFLKFAENYLEVDSAKLITGRGGGVLCNRCEVGVINPICKAYQEMMKIQLRLREELRKMARLLEKSQRSGSASNKLKGKSLKLMLLTNQLGIDNVGHLQAFRELLAEKCTLKGRETFPEVPAWCGVVDAEPTLEVIDLEPNTPLFDLDLDFSSSDGEDDDEIKIEIDALSEEHRISVSAIDPLDFHPVSEVRNDSNDEVDCMECGISFKNLERLQLHNRDSHQPLDCLLCQRVIGNNGMDNHLDEAHKETDLSCPSCSMTFPYARQLCQHIKNYHVPPQAKSLSGTAPLTEEEGPKKRRKQDFSQSSPREEHSKINRKSEEQKQQPKPKDKGEGCKCPSCPRVFTTVSSLLFHKNKCDSGLRHKCPQPNCKLAFKYEMDLEGLYISQGRFYRLNEN